MSILKDLAIRIIEAIKNRVDQRRAEKKEPAATQGEASYSEAEITEALDAAADGLDWRHSIVDLQKTLGLDSSFTYRQEVLAVELDIVDKAEDYTGTAEQNALMHKRVMDEVRSGGLSIPQSSS